MSPIVMLLSVPKTGAPRIVFEENSGLASVLPMDFVVEAIQTRLGK